MCAREDVPPSSDDANEGCQWESKFLTRLDQHSTGQRPNKLEPWENRAHRYHTGSVISNHRSVKHSGRNESQKGRGLFKIAEA
jgi:hypothetical protein